MNHPAKSKKHWIVLTMACLMCSASIGLILNTLGLFYVPVAQDLGIRVGDFTVHSTLNSLAMAVVSLFFPAMNHKLGFKPTMIIGVALAFIGTAGMGFTHQIWVFNILGIIRGTGAGLFATVPMTILVNNWFDEKNGLALSISNSFAGVAGAVFAPVITGLITNQGWETAFIWKGVFVVLFMLPVLFYPFSMNPEQDGYLPYGQRDHINDTGETLSSKGRVPFSYTSVVFLSLITFTVFQSAMMGLSTHMTAIGESFGMATQTAGIMTSALMIGNIVFKLLLGSLSDAIGVIKSTMIIIFINISGLVFLTTSTNPYLAVIGAFLFGSVFSVASVTFPVLAKEYFGRVTANRIFPLISFALNMGKAIAITTVGYVYDFTGSYLIVLVLAILFNLIDIGMIYIGVRKAKLAV